MPDPQDPTLPPNPPAPAPAPPTNEQPGLELPDGYGEALLARFGPPADTGLTEFEQGVGIDAYALFSDPAAPSAPSPTGATVATAGDEAPEPEGSVTPSGSELPAPTGDPVHPTLDTSGTPDPSADLGSGQADTGQSPAPVTATGGWDWSGVDPNSGAEVQQHYSDEEVITGLWLKAWSDNLSDDLRNALAAVETGDAIPISRAEYDQFSAWRQQQATAQRDHDLDQFEPEAAAEIKRLRDQLSGQQPMQQPMQGGQQPQFDSAQATANMTAWANLIDQAVVAYGAERGMTQPERDQIWHDAVHSGIIRYIADQKAVVSPTGQLIAPADPREVAREAMDITLARNPQVYAALAARASTTPTPSTVTSAPELIQAQPSTLPASAPDPAITAKKARAASVSAAPSAQVTPAPRDIAAMHSNDIVRLMEADLRADPAFAVNGHGQS